jgi:hypothetical protein
MTGEVESLLETKQPNLGAANAQGRLIEPPGLTRDDTGGGSVNFCGPDPLSRVVSGGRGILNRGDGCNGGRIRSDHIRS